MDRYAVLGNPIKHSLSPAIHEAFARQTGESLEYLPLLPAIDAFEETAERFLDEGGKGFNITAPFKGDAYDWVDARDSLAEEAGAVNTVALRKNQRVGYNTDGLGLMRDLERLNWTVRDARILILGAGGAARGIMGPLLKSGSDITIANRTVSRIDEIKAIYPSITPQPLDSVNGGWDIVINATSATRNSEEVEFDPSILLATRCYDLAYSRDGTTPFLDLATKEGALSTAEGLGMLVFQAAEAFALWRQIQPDGIPVLESLRTRPVTRRFIAGARCHRCDAQDTSYVELDDMNQAIARGCVECNFHQTADGATTVSLLGKDS